MLFENRSMMRNLSKGKQELYTQLPRLIEVEHRVNKGDKEEDDICRRFARVAAKGYMLAFNEAVIEEKLLEIIDFQLRLWGRLKEVAKKTRSKELLDLTRKFAILVYNAFRKAQKEEGEETKRVFTILNEAEGKLTAEALSALRTAMKRETGLSAFLTRRAMKSDILEERGDIKKLENLSNEIEHMITKIEHGDDPQKYYETLRAYERFSGKFIEEGFYHAYQIKKRDMFLMMMLLYDERVLEAMNKKWVVQHFIPEAVGKEEEIKLNEIRKKIEEQFHAIAQSLLITRKKIQGESQQALKLAA
jgi:hypothetical protein